jgi:hypothetical protein
MNKVEQYVEESQKPCRDEDLLDELWYSLTAEETAEVKQALAAIRQKPKS